MTQVARDTRDESHRQPTESNGRRLFLLSFLMLFSELMLIRWAAAFVISISYFTNFVLLASFLGIGLGFLRASRGKETLPWTPVALSLTLTVIVVFPVQVSRVGTRSFVGLFGMPALPVWITLPLIFSMVVVVMASIAQSAGRVFAALERLRAYRLDISGSLVGITAFSVLSFVGAAPLAWGVVVAATLVALLRPMPAKAVVGVISMITVLTIVSLTPRQSWSPYYRVTASSTSAEGTTGVRVNGLPHQAILPLQLMPERQPFYLYPYRHLGMNPLSDVLIIGAGTGNDVAVALAKGAQHLDAVEIDPVILSIGRHMHPDMPYSDPRVASHVGDGRAFLEQSNAEYDLIVFALPDSLTVVSGQGSLRLESYLFTLEARTSVRDHLAPGGAFTMYNYYRPDVFERFAGTINAAFGHPPCVDRGPNQLGARSQAVLTVGREEEDVQCANVWSVPRSSNEEIAVDDHPFPYLRSRSIPGFYLTTLLLILGASVLLTRGFGGPIRRMRPYADLFFMGTAFLLLETKNIVQFALLFGTTWFVNSLVFAGILLTVLAAIETAQRLSLPKPRVLYLALLAALTIAWFTPLESLLGLAVAPRFLMATSFAFAPVYFANLIFSQRFKETASSTVAFGANLLGAMVGGVLEYAALVVGYRDLLILVALLYVAALALTPRKATVEATTWSRILDRPRSP